MSTGEQLSSPVPRFLVSATSLPQSSIVLPAGSVIKSVPVETGSLLVDMSTRISDQVGKQTLDNSLTLRESKETDVKVSVKGRRPKSLVTEIHPGFELGLGMLADRPMCRSCGKYFMSRQQLNQHMLVHTDVRKYKCTYCERTFKQPSHLHQHHRIHTGEKPYKCPISGCFRAFPQQSNLNHHLRNHDKPAPPPENTCSLCMRTYASETVLRSHISKIHMCDPEMLLGSRKKTQTKEASRPQANEIVQFISSAIKDSVKQTETNNNTPSDENNINTKQQTDMKSVESRIVLPKRETVFAGDVNAKYFRNIHASGVLNGREETTHHKIGNTVGVNETLLKECGSIKEVPVKNNLYYNTAKQEDRDLLRYFIPTTTFSPTLNEGTDTYTSVHMTGTGGKRKASDLDVASGPSLSGSLMNPSVDDNDSYIQLTDESVSSHVGRSRKRKAFQPQRIIQKLDLKEYQEDIGTVPF